MTRKEHSYSQIWCRYVPPKVTNVHHIEEDENMDPNYSLGAMIWNRSFENILATLSEWRMENKCRTELYLQGWYDPTYLGRLCRANHVANSAMIFNSYLSRKCLNDLLKTFIFHQFCFSGILLDIFFSLGQ